MKHLWIIEKTQSTNLFYRNYSEIQLDPDLISGLLSALNNFSQVELRGTGIESIQMSGLSWVYLTEENLNLLLIAADTKTSNPEVMRSRLEVIKNIFVASYNITPEFWKQGLINVNIFNDFATTLDTLTEQWKQAEKVMGAAALFDILGVFQQILNLIISIVKTNFFGEKLTNIMTEIKNFAENMEDIKQRSELSQISFDPQQGWNIITLNPIELDEVLLKRALFSITHYLRMLIVKHLGYMIALNSFSKEIIPYILSNWDLLQSLDLTKPLLDTIFERSK